MEAATLPTTTLQPPTLKVVNAEKLYVEVSNTNRDNTDAKLRLIITGVDSGAQKAYELSLTDSSDDRVMISIPNDYTVILDDVASSGLHFGSIDADTTEKFIPGEDITIQAVAFSTTVLANIAYSSKYTTNSLFGSINTAKDTAYIGNIRHLENLDKSISNLDANDGTGDGIGADDKIKIKRAEQTDSFSWIGFQKAVKEIESKSDSGGPSEEGYETVCVYDFSGTNSKEGHYTPIAPDYALTYDGKSRSISDVAVDVTGDAGLFGKIEEKTVSEIKNLELIDFTVKGTDSAGALAGTLDGCTVTNVLARTSAASSTARITAATDAGGLIGMLASGTVQYSAASLIVGDSTNPPTNAGGLIGNASGTITGGYSGGHTKNGSYEEWVAEKDTEEHLIHSYAVTGVTVGGLVGTASAAISYSYSTCSVYTTSVTGAAGGFAGSASGSISSSISNC
ncbi:MAG: hypothetical protein IJH86_00650 [Clostridia bacterium]|nr:hypothetical protein [Clostridia bacterium]